MHEARRQLTPQTAKEIPDGLWARHPRPAAGGSGAFPRRPASRNRKRRGAFEKKIARTPRIGLDRRLTQQTAPSSASRAGAAMPRARLIAASLVVLMTGSAAWFYVGETQHASFMPSGRKQEAISYDQAIVMRPTIRTWAWRHPMHHPRLRRRRTLDGALQIHALNCWLHRRACASGPVEQGAPSEPVRRDRFTGAAENIFRIVREARFDLLHRRGHGLVLVRPRLAQSTSSAAPCGPRRGDDQLFPYAYPAPTTATEPFRTTVAVFPSPWSEGRKIVQIGIRGYAVQAATRPRANLVFLIDTSGSMNAPNRLPLVKQSLAMLLTQLAPDDRVAIVTYAGHAGTALEQPPRPTRGRLRA